MSNSSANIQCAVCLKPIPHSKGNRPRLYCPSTDGKPSLCARIAQRLDEVERLVKRADLSPDARRDLRSRLFRHANTL